MSTPATYSADFSWGDSLGMGDPGQERGDQGEESREFLT